MKQFAVIGLGRFGASVAKTLAEKRQQVLAIDINEEKVQEFSEFVTQAVCIDATDEKALKAVGIKDVDVAIVSVGDDIEASILITLVLKEIGIKEIITKAVTEEQGKVLEKIGANRIIFPERDMGIRLAASLISKD
jgi:trk system potassium uptake protein TrkA